MKIDLSIIIPVYEAKKTIHANDMHDSDYFMAC